MASRIERGQAAQALRLGGSGFAFWRLRGYGSPMYSKMAATSAGVNVRRPPA